MVPLSFNLYRLAECTHRELLNRLDQVTPWRDSLDFAWLVYGLAVFEKPHGPHFKAQLNQLEKWAVSDDAGAKDRHLGALCLYYYLSQQPAAADAAKGKIRQIIERGLARAPASKFDVLNDPGQLFCVALARSALDSSMTRAMRKILSQRSKGRPLRKAFLRAACFEIDEQAEDIKDIDPGDNADDVLTVLCLKERYKLTSVTTAWERLQQVLPDLQNLPALCEHALSSRSLALLAEAVYMAITHPDPQMLFDLFPFGPQIRRISEDHFRAEKYAAAVFEATKKLNEFIQQVSGSSKSEVALVQATMKFRNGLPIIQFNEYLEETSGKNEQTGLALIAEGVFKAYRNPKGHKPEDHQLATVDPWEALAQLVTIDYIWRRVSEAKVLKEQASHGASRKN